MNEILQYIIVGLTVLVIAVNIATTLSPRFRRWVYSKD
jgi:hypothetical protein